MHLSKVVQIVALYFSISCVNSSIVAVYNTNKMDMDEIGTDLMATNEAGEAVRLNVDEETDKEHCQNRNFVVAYSNSCKKYKCEPRDDIVTLVSSSNSVLLPNAVVIKKCKGMCMGGKKCLAVETKTTEIYVRSTTPDFATTCHVVPVVEDVKCTCGCANENMVCKGNRHFSKKMCDCQCPNKMDHIKCLADRTMDWDDLSCTCFCKQTKKCTTGTVWNKSECRCRGSNLNNV